MSTKVITGKVRFSFVNVYEPKEPQGGGKAKYSVTLLIPKSDTATLDKIKAAQAEAREVFCKRNGANALPAKPVHTLYDGDGVKKNGDEFGPECKGHYVIAVSSERKPVLVDEFGNETNDPNCIYSGCYGRAAINFFGYNQQGNKGISAGLLSLKKLHDGEPFGTVGSASDFDDDWMDDDADDLLD
jgi:hypothetical protein